MEQDPRYFEPRTLVEVSQQNRCLALLSHSCHGCPDPLRDVTGADPPTLTVPSRLRFTSTETLNAFTRELTYPEPAGA